MAHEKVHHDTCESQKPTPTFRSTNYEYWINDPRNLSQNEIDAYTAGIKTLDIWIRRFC